MYLQVLLESVYIQIGRIRKKNNPINVAVSKNHQNKSLLNVQKSKTNYLKLA